VGVLTHRLYRKNSCGLTFDTERISLRNLAVNYWALSIGHSVYTPGKLIMANISEELQVTTDNGLENSSQVFLPFPRPPGLSIASLVVGLVTGVTGMCANAVVFVVLVFARRNFGSVVNTLIANQSAMDLLACIFLTIAFGLSFPGAPQNYLVLGDVGNNIVCFLFRYRVLAIVCQNAEKTGLVVITLERYFKINHVVIYNKYCRNLKVSVGVAVPWITGFCTFFIPAVLSARDRPGRCPRMGAWPTKHGRTVSK